jgi:hypothetical protein
MLLPRLFRIAIVGLLCSGIARASNAVPQSTNVQTGLHILADSAPYHFQFDNKEGGFADRTFGALREQRFSVTYLHTDAGPTGYSKHLAWFLARDAVGFAVLWCYLDDSGKDFWCWLYRYPTNSLTTQHFTGEYRFAPPSAAADTLEPGFALPNPPAYSGPDFTFLGWSRKAGAIASLPVYESITTEKDSSFGAAAADSTSKDRTPSRTLINLIVQPLHQLQVGGANGWRTGGWEELHVFARDSAADPYYLILYSNSKQGFVVDLKRARTYTADFGARVVFNDDVKAYGPKGNPAEQEDVPTVKRNQAYEIALATTKSYDNPYTDVILDVELTGPDRHTIRIPGYWDGGKNWKIRFAPPKVGNWTWKTFSTDKDIDGKVGVVECMPESDPTVGFVHVHPYASQSRHYAIGQATGFYPAYMYDPVQFDPASAISATTKTAVALSSSSVPASGSRLKRASDITQPSGKLPATFIAFQNRMDALHGAGFNRLTGGYVLLGDTSLGEPRNEGGTAFVNGDLYRLNAEYFRWMDRRIAYCNSLGIVPDVGLARSPAIAFSANNDAQLRSLWRYLLARYSAFDICWNIFGPVAADNTLALARIQPFAVMQGKYDLFHHPVTSGLVITSAYLKKVTAVPAKTKGAGTPSTVIGRAQLAELEGPPLGLPSWMDNLSVQAGDPQLLYVLDTIKKPITVVSDGQTAGVTDMDARAALWGARMRCAYFTIDQPVGPAPSLTNPLVKAMETSDTFFKQVRYSRLEPHNELLEAQANETPEAKRRRHLANIQAGAPVNTGDAGTSKDPNAPPPAALVLADPSREYVLYFKHGGFVTIDLLEATGRIKVTWLNLSTGESREDAQIVGGTYHAFAAPDDKDWVLNLKRL